MASSLFRQIFPNPKPVIAMVHIFEGNRTQQIDQALEDTERLQKGGVDSLMVENYDCGYEDANCATEEIADRLTEIAIEVRKHAKIPVGLNILPNDYWKAFNVALSVGGMFIQMDHITGDFVGCDSVDPDDYCQTRKYYPNIIVFGGIHPKYYELLEPTCSLITCADKAMTLADAVVITGEITGDPATFEDLQIARRAIGTHPLIVGSGLTPQNVQMQLAIADGAIVGTTFKRHGVQPGEPIDIDLVQQFMDKVSKLR